MKIVGLTGGIGSGKSTVAKMFRELGVPVYDSDEEAKKLMVSSTEVKEAIIELLGKKAYSDAVLDRTFIAKKVFKDPELLQQLNAIVHPAVREHFLEWAQKKVVPYVIQETALIFENGVQDKYDYTILVTAPKEIRLQRVMDRDGVDEQQVVERMQNQMEDNKKIQLANFCIENVDLETTKQKIKDLHTELVALSASKF
ncbi:dephospho-CoA kinase [Muricauda sp. CAU 1633]|uniref:dephospho-CoA kinase n=1 Tax=Allomuricauda sp. CAU 1633 TaxID=2816036 RepID=UPI001A8FA5B8|nr:dephospho-CoA kinase [Muricauda sp. CAU 1633]MBO0324211.1 dephospho-CoA kinase [Muricauda sp. CAU 1633]